MSCSRPLGRLLLNQDLPVQVETELLQEYETQLLEKEHSGCAALLQDDKVRGPHLQPV